VNVPTATTGDEAITLEVVSESFTHVNVRYVNADTKTEIAQNTTNFTTLPTAAVSTTAGSGSISFQLKTTSTDNISYTIKQGDTVVKTATTSAANASVTASSLTVAQTAEVVVEISGLSAAKDRYTYTDGGWTSGKALSTLGLGSLATDGTKTVKVEIVPTSTSTLVSGTEYALDVTLSAAPADFAAYTVKIPALNEEVTLYTGHLTERITFTADKNVDLSTTGAVAVSGVAKLTATPSGHTAGSASITVTFNRPVVAGNTAGNIKVTTDGSSDDTSAVVTWAPDGSSLTVTRLGGGTFAATATVEVKTTALEDAYGSQINTGVLATVS